MKRVISKFLMNNKGVSTPLALVGTVVMMSGSLMLLKNAKNDNTLKGTAASEMTMNDVAYQGQMALSSFKGCSDSLQNIDTSGGDQDFVNIVSGTDDSGAGGANVISVGQAFGGTTGAGSGADRVQVSFLRLGPGAGDYAGRRVVKIGFRRLGNFAGGLAKDIVKQIPIEFESNGNLLQNCVANESVDFRDSMQQLCNGLDGQFRMNPTSNRWECVGNTGTNQSLREKWVSDTKDFFCRTLTEQTRVTGISLGGITKSLCRYPVGVVGETATNMVPGTPSEFLNYFSTGISRGPSGNPEYTSCSVDCYEEAYFRCGDDTGIVDNSHPEAGGDYNCPNGSSVVCQAYHPNTACPADEPRGGEVNHTPGRYDGFPCSGEGGAIVRGEAVACVIRDARTRAIRLAKGSSCPTRNCGLDCSNWRTRKNDQCRGYEGWGQNISQSEYDQRWYPCRISSNVCNTAYNCRLKTSETGLTPTQWDARCAPPPPDTGGGTTGGGTTGGGTGGGVECDGPDPTRTTPFDRIADPGETHCY